MKKSSIVQRSKASSTWRNNTVRMLVRVTIPVGKILICVALLLIIWGMI